MRMYLCPSILPFASSLSPFCWPAIRALQCARSGCLGFSAAIWCCSETSRFTSGVGRIPARKSRSQLHGISHAAAGDSLGNWSLFLAPESSGGPYRLTVTGSNKIVLDDILVGDVWFASGQSNMEMPLKGWPGAPLKNSAEEVAHAGQPQIRLLTHPAQGRRLSPVRQPPRHGPSARPKRPLTFLRWPTSSGATWPPVSAFPSDSSIPPGAARWSRRG